MQQVPFLKSFLPLAIFVAAVVVGSVSCTKEISVNIPKDAQQLVVEGNIEIDRPPVILLSKSQSFFDNIDINNLAAYYVHDAKMTVKSGTDSVELVEYCLNNLPISDEQKKQLLESYGFNIDDSVPLPNVCIYSIPDLFNCLLNGNCSMVGKENTSYDLRIEVEGKVLTASTTIPTPKGVDYLEIRPRPKPIENDSFVSVFVNITVPDTFGNFVRYWTKRNKEPFYLPASQSVWNDKLFVGLSIALPMERGYAKGTKVNTEDYSYFLKGDTVTLKWANIDNKTYDFYYTLENDGSGSPFANPVKVKTNIAGGALGVWAGYATKYYTIVVPK
ncbi:MAG: DUF4249 family protein [Chitinophagales bacterium]|nr:DUF4249 family protein [Chitinophagales bacterium]